MKGSKVEYKPTVTPELLEAIRATANNEARNAEAVADEREKAEQ